MPTGTFGFESLGIGDLIRKERLQVPLNQRPYAWEEVHVRTLLEDLHEAIQRDDEDYFLGTIVLVRKGNETPSIADGQQRLVTTSIILARIRDKQLQLDRRHRAQAIDTEYLRSIDMDTEEMVPRLRLNTEDHGFFVSEILKSVSDPEDLFSHRVEPQRPSNYRLQKASEVIEEYIDQILAPFKSETHSDILNSWVSYIRNNATVVAVTASDEVGAYRMFETLNDRGVQASQADILKNFLFSKAGNRISEAQARWQSVLASIESLPDDADWRLVTFIRHLWILKNGPTKERELAASIRNAITSETRAMSFLDEASSAVQDYVALWSSQNPAWARHRSGSRMAIDTISNHLRVEQIRPLLFAILRHFDIDEAEKAFRLCVAWSVRFLIYGGRGGMLDQQYSLRAQEIGTGRISKARELRDAMSRYVPTDAEFEAAFATARVSRSYLARYYLRALEKSMKADAAPEFVINEDVSHVTLEHILPLTPGSEWDLDIAEVESSQRLLGNMVLLRARDNREAANSGFAQKKGYYGNSGYFSTQMVAEYENWGLGEIRDRQARLAKLAVQTWSTSFLQE